VDADLVGAAQSAPGLAITTVSHNELPMGSDAGTLWELVFLLQIGVVLSVLGVISWRRWGHAQTWVVFGPTLTLLALYVTAQVTRLLPNLI
jgi:hypothetical protein